MLDHMAWRIATPPSRVAEAARHTRAACRSGGGSRARSGCQCSGAGNRGASAICGSVQRHEPLQLFEPVLDDDKSRRLGGFRASHHQELLPVERHVIVGRSKGVGVQHVRAFKQQGGSLRREATRIGAERRPRRSPMLRPIRTGADLHAPAARRGHDAVETQVHGHLAVDVPGVTDHEVHQAHP